MIRLATVEDLPRIVELGRQMHAESPRWSRLPFSEARSAATMRTFIETKDHALWVAERNGEVIGGAAALIVLHWSSTAYIAYEHCLFVEQSQRGGLVAARLIMKMVDWAYDNGAMFLQAGAGTGLDHDKTSALYRRLGFKDCAIGLEYFYGN